jgi:predicted anti-sigma-YlaC factor YlaD
MTRAPACDRAREWVSLALDGELSRFETAVLEAHVERCPACRDFRAQVAVATAVLRLAEPEMPAARVRVPTRHRALPRVVEPLAGVAVTVALVLGGFSVSVGPGHRGDGVAGAPTANVIREVTAMREYQRLQREIRIEEAVGSGAKRFQRPLGIQVPLTAS